MEIAGLYRPERFDEIVGHDALISQLKDRVMAGTLSHFIILYGEEGLGKTTIADHLAIALDCTSMNKPCYTCPICKEAIDKVVRHGQSTQDIIKFNITHEGGMEEAKRIIEAMNGNYLKGSNKVIIAEDLHSMETKAQELLLTPMELIPSNVYVIATVNSLRSLSAKLKSRAVIYQMHRLQKKEMVSLLKTEAIRRHLTVASDAVYSMIASWADYKPRKALKVLEAMGSNARVSTDEVKEFISYLDISKMIPIIEAFKGSPLTGMTACMSMPIDDSTQKYIVDILIATIMIANKQRTPDVEPRDRVIIETAVKGLDIKIIENFLLEICRMPYLDNRRLLAAFLACHPNHRIFTPNPAILDKERSDRFNAQAQETVLPVGNQSRDIRISIDDLMGGTTFEDE